MSNIFHDIKRGLLILGFTGPLSSGCTTAADFFENDINAYIEEKKKIFPSIGAKIEQKYRIIKNAKSSISESNYRPYRKINATTNHLKELLKVREILTVLDEYHDNSFKTISMTDVLLKLVIERLADNRTTIDDIKIQKLKSLIDYDSLKLGTAKEVSDKVRRGDLSTLTEHQIKIYEQYLDYVKSYRNRLKEEFNDEELGTLLQDLGDNARKCGNPIDGATDFKKDKARTLFILAEEAKNLIDFFRYEKRSECGKHVYKQFVVEAFRNPYEVYYFRNRYYEFYLFSIYAHLSIRQKRGNFNEGRDRRDRGDNLKPEECYKQNVSECVHLSDIAINNDAKKHIFYRKLSKYFALICMPGCIAPEDDELYMQQAYCMSLMSNCISRQVGAVIVERRGYIVGAGWNDVGSGQIPCGFRRFDDIRESDVSFPIAAKTEEEDFCSFLAESRGQYLHHVYCFKDEYSRFKTAQKVDKLSKPDSPLALWRSKYNVGDEAFKELTDFAIKNLSPKRLEYCRALHAEENAILQNSIIGGIGIEGTTIYTTTFPCELCAKKIYQARIKRVVYTEPYPGSISEEVFFKDGSHSIDLVQFEGIKSHSYYRLYKPPVDIKEFQVQERL